MKNARAWMGIVVWAFLAQGCADSTHTPGNIVGIDLKHGRAWPNLAETLVAGGYQPVLIEQEIDSAALRGVSALFTTGTTEYSGAEIRAIARFVKNGGGLLCAAQAWSWSYEAYGGKPNDTFPLNGLGRKLNFRITENAIGNPTYLETEIMAGIAQLTRETEWSASQIEIRSAEGRAVVRDEQQRVMGAVIPCGKGRVAVYGHGDLPKENPVVLLRTLAYLTAQP